MAKHEARMETVERALKASKVLENDIVFEELLDLKKKKKETKFKNKLKDIGIEADMSNNLWKKMNERADEGTPCW